MTEHPYRLLQPTVAERLHLMRPRIFAALGVITLVGLLGQVGRCTYQAQKELNARRDFCRTHALDFTACLDCTEWNGLNERCGHVSRWVEK